MDATHDSAALVLAVGSAFGLFAGGFWLIVSLGRWALDPTERGVVAARVPAQFSLREFVLLAVQMQLAIGVAFWWCERRPELLWIVLVLGSALLLAWWQGVRRLANCRVTCGVRRALFLSIVVPLATLSIGGALWLNGYAVLQTCLGRHWDITAWLAGNLAIIGAFVTCRLLAVWTMHNVTPMETAELHDDGIQYVS